MAPLITAAGVVYSVVASARFIPVHAFSCPPPVCTGCNCKHATSTSSWRSFSSPIILQMSDNETSADDTTATVEESSEPLAEPIVNPEVIALKESISSLESDLKVKKYQLSDLQQKADKFSSAGYAREVARGVNNKRTRGANNSDTKSAARAVVMRSFLPVLEELDAVGAKYEGVAFAKTFDAGIRSEFEKALSGLGVTEYTAESGQSIDVGRVVAVQEAYSDEFAKGMVIRAVKSGLEISGNVVRSAEVVGSLGSESVMKEAVAEGGEDSAEVGAEASVEEGGKVSAEEHADDN